MTIIALIILIYIGVVFQNYFFGYGFENKLEYKCYFTREESFEGDELYFVECVLNKNFIPIPWLRVEINSSKWLDFANSNSVVAQEKRYITSNFALAPYQKIERKWKMTSTKRGFYKVNIVTLISGDLFGLNRYSIPVNVEANLMVYPNHMNLNKIFKPVSYKSGSVIVRHQLIDDPFTYKGSREYMYGDKINKIDWKATARTGNMMVREYDYTSNDDFSIVLNIQSQELEYYGTMDRKLIETAIKVASSILYEAKLSNIPVKFLSNGVVNLTDKNSIKTKSGISNKHFINLYKILAMLQFKNIEMFEELIKNQCKEIKNTNFIIITAYLNEEIVRSLKKLKRNKNSVKVFFINNKNFEFSLDGLEVLYIDENFIS